MFQRKSRENTIAIPSIIIPLAHIQKVDQTGIHYSDNEGNSAYIDYSDAYKGWCKSKGIKKSKPAYICDRTKSEGWKLIFYTNPQITFCSNPCEKELYNDIINNISMQGHPSFDQD